MICSCSVAWFYSTCLQQLSEILCLPWLQVFGHRLDYIYLFLLASEDWQSDKGLEETNLYMLDKGLGSDITLVTGSTQEPIPAHKFVLASRSMVNIVNI